MRPAVLLLFSLTLFAQDATRDVNFYSLEKERALGEQIAKDYRSHATIIELPKLQARVAAIGRTLIPAGSKYNYTFEVVDSDEYLLNEPTALPGGFIFVSSGLIRAVRHTDEFAGMLAHAIAHVESRQGMRTSATSGIVNQATIPLIFIGGWTGNATTKNTSPAVPLGFLTSFRAAELQADQMAARLMQAAGYSPARLADYIERVQPPDDGTVNPRSPLPPRAARVAALRAFPAVDTPNGIVALQELLPELPPKKAKTPPSLAR